MLPRKLPKPKRRETVVRSAGHLRFVRSHACSVHGCIATDIEAAHVRTGTDGAMGAKPGDDWTLSLCATHHALQHAKGERWFQATYRIDMKALAAEFWRASPHGARKRRAA